MKKPNASQALSLIVLGLVALAPKPAVADVASCGQAEISCEANEKCCEHIIAMFSPDGASAPPYKEGNCVPKEQRCADFWCGGRHCESGLFGTPSVCCVLNDPARTTQYRCAYNELSCPGNTQQLTIRDTDSNHNPS